MIDGSWLGGMRVNLGDGGDGSTRRKNGVSGSGCAYGVADVSDEGGGREEEGQKGNIKQFRGAPSKNGVC